jgi:hypothetical protein
MPNKSLPKRECGIAFPLNASPVSGNYQHRVGMSTNPPEATGSLALPRAGTWKKFNGALRDNLSVDETNSEPRIKGHWAIVGTLKKECQMTVTPTSSTRAHASFQTTGATDGHPSENFKVVTPARQDRAGKPAGPEPLNLPEMWGHQRPRNAKRNESLEYRKTARSFHGTSSLRADVADWVRALLHIKQPPQPPTAARQSPRNRRS